jgi:uncharacterized membrane protein YdfJ with MMPL/SSD domain
VQLDGREAATRDTLLIVPIALLIVFAILMVLLRAVLAPLLLIGTVILSFGAALGVSLIVYDVIFGFPGSDASLPLYAFVFLVALGIDYNIFLMARVREETLRHGTHAGMIRGLAVTGAVITSAGIVLAGTFACSACSRSSSSRRSGSWSPSASCSTRSSCAPCSCRLSCSTSARASGGRRGSRAPTARHRRSPSSRTSASGWWSKPR